MAATFYAQILRSFDWTRIVNEAEAGFDEVGEPIKSNYLGSVFNIFPSGKYYMPWSTNVTPKEAEVDERYAIALEKAANKFGGTIQGGQGDPTDIYFVMPRENEESDEHND